MPEKDLITEMHTDLKWIKDKLSKLDLRYASKWTEGAMKAVIYFIVFAFLGAVAGLVFVQTAGAIF